MVKTPDRAWKLIADPKNWGRERYAADLKGRFAYIDSPEATCWCMVGAMRRVYSGQALFYKEDALSRFIDAEYPQYRDIPQFNDSPTTTHATVLAILKKLDI